MSRISRAIAIAVASLALLLLPTGTNFVTPRPAAAVASGATNVSPLNFNFDAPSYTTGGPPTNNNFETNNLNAWTDIQGTVTVETGGPTGSVYYARMGGGSQITSAAFSVPTNAQTLSFDRTFFSGSSGIVVRVAPGPSYNVWTDAYPLESTGSAQPWETKTVNVTQWAGQSIKLRFEVPAGSAGIDNTGVIKVVHPSWTTWVSGTAHSNVPELWSDGPTGNYSRLGGGERLWTSPFTVPANGTTIAQIRRTFFTGSVGLAIYVLSGSDFATENLKYLESSGTPLPWEIRSHSNAGLFDLSTWAGEKIKLRLEAPAGTIGVDDVVMNFTAAASDPNKPVAKTPDPVDTTSGAFSHSHTDIVIPGRGVPLEFTRSYSSMSMLNGVLGHRWTHNYSWSLRIESDGEDATVTYPSGSTVRFDWNGGTQTFTAPAGTFDTLVRTGTSPNFTYTLTTKSQIKYEFTGTSPVLTAIKDRNNNTTTLTYTSGLLTSVSDPGGRSLTFTYDGSNRIFRVTDPLPSPDTRTVEFTYDGNGDLWKVKDVKAHPTNGPFTVYAYSSHRMTSLTDSNNHVANQNIYDDANRVVEQLDAVGSRTCIYYGTAYGTTANCTGVSPVPAEGETVMVNPRGDKTTYSFDTTFRTTDIKDHNGGIVHYDFNSNNNITCLTDQRGKKTAYSYDTRGDVTQMIDAVNTDASCALKAGGVAWTYTYTSINDIDLETDPLGRQTDYIYESTGNLTRVVRKDSGGAVKALSCLERDSFGQVTGIVQSTNLTVPPGATDPCTGHRMLSGYDAYGNLICTVNARFTGTTNCASDPGKKASFVFDLGGRLLYSTNEITNNSKPVRGNAPEIGSQCGTDGNGNGVNDDSGDDSTIDDGCPSTKYTYDAQSNVLTVTDGLSNATSSSYDAKGTLKSVTEGNRQAVGAAETGAQCGTLNARLPVDQVVSSTNLTGATVDNLDDDPDAPDGAWATATTVEDTSLRTGFPTPAGSPTIGAGLQEFRIQLRKNTAGGNNPTYDLQLWETGGGAPLATLATGVSLSSDTGIVVSATWNASLLGTASGSAVELVVVGHRSGGSPSSRRTVEVGAVEWNAVYPNPLGTGDGVDNDGDTVIDDGCLSTIYVYDNRDRLTTVTNALGETTSYGYDANGNRTSVTNAKRQPVGAAETGTSQCGTGGTGNGVDDDGDGTKDDGCSSIVNAFDVLDRLQSSTDALGRVTSSQYDAASNLTQRTDARGLVTKYFPDDLNRLDLVEHWNGMTLVDSVDYTYNAAGFRTQMIDPTGTTSYTPDALNRVASVTFPGPKTVSYTYDDLPGGSAADYPGQRTKITYPDAKFVDYTYDEANNMKTVTDWLSKQTVYTYDDAGRLTKTQLPNTAWTDFGYDAADRLTSVVNRKTGPITISSFTYTLDKANNRTQMVDLSGTHSYQYDALYRLKQVTYPGPATDSYSYDPAGNRLSMTQGAKTTNYTYDAADQMLTAGTVSYGYDANGNQTSRGADTFTYDHENRLTQSVVAGVTSSSIYNGDGLRMSHTEAAVTTNFTWDVAAGRPVVLQDGTKTYVYGLDLISETDGADVQTYFLYDGLGSTTGLADGAGNNPVSYSYDVFGRVRTQTGTSPNYWLFTGEQRDGQPGLSPAVQRLPLDQVVSSTNLNGATVDNLDDDPDSPDAAWATATTVADTSLRVGFPTPAGNPTPGTGLQEFRVQLRKNAAGGNNPTYDIELWETGGSAPLATLVSGATLSSETGTVVSATWDASLLSTASGSAVEVRIVGHRSGGSPSSRRTVEVGAVEWNADHQGTPSSELYFLRARYYDPAIGRFLGQDPLRTGNLYTYVGNDPVNFADPTGLQGTSQAALAACAGAAAYGAAAGAAGAPTVVIPVGSASGVAAVCVGSALVAICAEGGCELIAGGAGAIIGGVTDVAGDLAGKVGGLFKSESRADKIDKWRNKVKGAASIAAKIGADPCSPARNHWDKNLNGQLKEINKLGADKKLNFGAVTFDLPKCQQDFGFPLMTDQDYTDSRKE